MTLTEVTDESKCCCSCGNNIRTYDKVWGCVCHCDKDGHYIGYVANFQQVCEEWEEDNGWEGVSRMGRKYIIEIIGGEEGDMDFSTIEPYTEPDMEQVRKEAYDNGYENGFIAGHLKAEKSGQSFYEDGYKRGLADAWEAARTLWNTPNRKKIFGHTTFNTVLTTLTAQETIEKIRQYEQEKEEQEQSVTAEEVMRQYLDTFCKGKSCTRCLLHTPDFTCGRGYHFLTNKQVSDEEVRKAYAAVLAKMKE